jgi:uncharacterized protein (TIGR03118 family)
MKQMSSLGRRPGQLLVVVALLSSGSLLPVGAGAEEAPASTTSAGTVLQSNLVSDLPGAAAATDPNLVNSWGISESGTSPFWISDNGAGLSTLYAGSTTVSINPLVVNIPSPAGPTGGTPTGTVFNTGLSSGAFTITGQGKSGTTSAPAAFLFATEDGTIAAWSSSIDPTGQFGGPSGVSNHAILAVDSSGDGAVYKGMTIATNSTPIITGDANSTALLFVANFHAGTIEVYD